jgi:hypothetical protein
MELRAHHLQQLELMLIEGYDYTLRKFLEHADDSEFAEMSANLYFHILSNLYSKIKITNSLDSICWMGRCRTENCINGTVPEIDRKVALEYDVEIGKEYSAGELVEKIRVAGFSEQDCT